MKTRFVLLSLSVLLFSSCIVKSIQPFYTQDTISFEKRLIGDWKTGTTTTWKIISFKEEWEKENDPNTNLTKEDKQNFERYKNSYYVEYTKDETKASFIAMPFKLGDYFFLDFTPFEYDSGDLNRLAAQHLLKTHSAAFVEFNTEGFDLKWIPEGTIGRLIREKKLRIKHEKTGIDDDLILTATTKELQSFLKKFITSEIDNKWDNDDIYKLRKIDAAP